jgi:glycosyltransferase involved in cell wall biosynthesis
MGESQQTRDRCTVLLGIVTKDRADILPKSIESALSQRGASINVSVIDDGSKDKTAEIWQRFPSVEWTTWPESRGYVAARNYWMKSAKEEFFVSLDDDAWFLRGDEIALACERMNADEQVGAIAFDILSPDRPTVRQRSEITAVPTFVGCGHMVRLTAAREVGLYETNPGNYGVEEKDLCLRLLDAGYKIIKLFGVHVWHDKTKIGRTFPSQYASGVCNDLVLTYRRTPLFLLPFALVAKFFQHVVAASRRDLTKSCWQGFRLFVRSLRSLRGTRKPVRFSTLRNFVRLGRA